jgi:hypothetical protein
LDALKVLFKVLSQIITLEEFYCFVLWAVADSIFYLVLTPDYKLNPKNSKEKEKVKKSLRFQLNNVVACFLIIFCVGLLINKLGAREYVDQVLATVFGLDVTVSVTNMTACLVIITLIKLWRISSKNFKSNGEDVN